MRGRNGTWGVAGVRMDGQKRETKYEVQQYMRRAEMAGGGDVM